MHGNELDDDSFDSEGKVKKREQIEKEEEAEILNETREEFKARIKASLAKWLTVRRVILSPIYISYWTPKRY